MERKTSKLGPATMYISGPRRIATVFELRLTVDRNAIATRTRAGEEVRAGLVGRRSSRLSGRVFYFQITANRTPNRKIFTRRAHIKAETVSASDLTSQNDRQM
ncbi:hypothetical protein [Klebsiella pneumoniae]|uniref:hypothetical protein n=1 Tax=Klebsiella pneumoniae TaxID=573 RepID=UPI00388EA49C